MPDDHTPADREGQVADALRADASAAAVAAAGVAADQPRDPLLQGDAPTEPRADAALFRLRDCLAVTDERAAVPIEALRSSTGADALRDAAAELARLVRELDLHLTAGTWLLPLDWRPVDDADEGGTSLDCTRACSESHTFAEGCVLHTGVRRGGYFPEPTTESVAAHERELAMRHAFGAGLHRGRYEKALTWVEDTPLDEDAYIERARDIGPLQTPVLLGGEEPREGGMANTESAWRPSGHETTFPCQVHVRVTYRDGTDAYYPVPADEGWTINTVRREVVIGKGLGRIHVPLDVVWSYSPEECHPVRGRRVTENEAGPTARSDR